MKDKVLNRHVFSFNEKANGGEQLILVTNFHHNGDGPGGIYTSQELSLQSYCNAATFSLHGAAITPEALRELANQLDRAKIEAMTKCVEEIPAEC